MPHQIWRFNYPVLNQTYITVCRLGYNIIQAQYHLEGYPHISVMVIILSTFSSFFRFVCYYTCLHGAYQRSALSTFSIVIFKHNVFQVI